MTYSSLQSENAPDETEAQGNQEVRRIGFELQPLNSSSKFAVSGGKEKSIHTKDKLCDFEIETRWQALFREVEEGAVVLSQGYSACINILVPAERLKLNTLRC